MSKKHIAGLALFFVIFLLSSVAYGNNAGGFGPQEMTIKKWRSHLSRHTFDLEQAGDGILEISKNSPSSEFKGGFIFFNRKLIGLRKFFNGEDQTFEKEVHLKSANRLFVFARGKHGASFTLTIRPKDSYTPEIVSFTASPPMIHIGESSTLAWQTNNVETCEITPGVGIVDCNASTSVEPLMPTTYTLTASGWGQTVTATVTVEILNSAPVADAQEITTDEDTALPIALSGSDADNDPLTFEVFSEPLYGTLTGEAPDLIYTPDENFDKSDSFEFIVNDGELDSELALVAITVTPVNDAPVAHAQTVSLNEDESKAVLLSATDVDEEDELTYEIISQPAYGTLDGDPLNVTYTPAANFYGSDSFKFSVDDGIADPSSAVVTIVVNSVNDAPVAVDDTAAAAEDHPVVIDVLANDEDVDGDALSVSEFTPPVYGTVDYNVDGTVTYMPYPNYYGNDSFSYTLSDGAGGTDEASVQITINPINDAPVAQVQSQEMDEDVPFAITLSATDVDNDPLKLTYAISSGPSHGTLSGTAPNITYTPDPDYNDMDEFFFTASDGDLISSPAKITLIILDLNDAPVAADDSANTDEDNEVVIDVLANDGDVDGDGLTVSEFTQPAHGTVAVNGDGTLTYTPDLNHNGNDSFTYTASDGQGGSDGGSVTITINPVNDVPVAADDVAVTDEDNEVVINVLANDVDVDGDALTVTGFTAPANGTVENNNDGSLTYTPNPDFNGNDSFTYTASDGQGGTDIATVTITINPINDVPVAADDAAVTDEDSSTSINVLANDVDIDGDTLTVTGFTAPANGTVENNNDGSLTYTPNPDFNGDDSFSYTLSDGAGGIDEATVNITITSINDAPVAQGQSQERDEDEQFPIDLIATDVDNNDLSYEVSGPSHGTLSGTAPNLIYTPEANFHGTDIFTFTANDGFLTSSAATVTLTIMSVNDAPVAQAQSQDLDEDDTIDILLSATDVDSAFLTYQITDPPDHGTLSGSLPDVTYTPNADYHGADSFQFIANDGIVDSAVALINITVNPINDAPVAADDAAVTDEDNQVVIDVLNNDHDIDGDTLTIAVLTAPGNGSVQGHGDGTVTYTPDLNHNGSDSFSYTLSDGAGGTDEATVNITINPINDAPVAADDAAVTDEDNEVVIDVLANDRDIEGDTLTVTGFTTPGNGSVQDHSDGKFTYTPDPDYDENDSFSYTLSDGEGESDVATVTITINPVNDAPVASDNTVMLDEDKAQFADLIAFDVDDDPMTYEIIDGPTDGVLSGTAPSLIYTPNPDFYGSDTFTFTASDGPLTSNTATVTLLISPVNDAPVANAGLDKTVSRLDKVDLDGSGSDDVDFDDVLSFQWFFTSRPSGSTAVLSNFLTAEPSFVADLTGVYEIQLTVNDGLIDSPADTVTITAIPRIVTVPDVLGLKQAVAESLIDDADLEVGAISTAHSETVPMNHIISQSPSGGSQLEEYSAVDLVVSLGSESAAPVVSISASPAEIEQGQASVLSWTVFNAHSAHIDNGVGTVEVTDSVQVFPEQTTTYTITAIGAFGNANAKVVVKVTSHPEPPPEGSYGEQYEDLIPDDATVEEYAPERFALITGLVYDEQGAALSDVSITMHGHAEYGTVYTDDQGVFSIPVEGGGTLTVDYKKQGLIPAQRKVYVPWNDNAVVETVVLIAEDPLATTLTFDNNPETVVIHKSSDVTDESGTRAFTMVFKGDNRAYLVDEKGDDVGQLDTITVRATEYASPESMPAKLPPNSAFTYCAEAKVDGVQRVRFEKPVTTWIDNFLGLPVGEIVPVGYYDRDQGAWVPLENGLVVELLDSDADGNVDALDADGDGQKDDLDEDGFFNDEIEGLDDPVRYAPGHTFWRAELTHFSPLDFNLPWGPPLDAEFSNASGGGISDGQKADGTDPQRHICSFVEEKSRVFHEDIAIPGTDLTLHYASSRVAGYKPGVISVPASLDTIPQSLKRIEVQVNVAGRQYEVQLPGEANQFAEIEWDGLDHLGRPVTGTAMAHIRVGYVYQAVYYSADAFFGQSFGQPGLRPLTIPARQEMTLWRDRWIVVNRGKGVLAEGWTLSAHHQFSPVDPSILYLGDGTISRNNVRIIETIAGDGSYGYSGDGGPASEAKLNFPAFLTINSAGELFIADVSNLRIRKIDVIGIIDTIAGNGSYGTSGDGGPAIDAQIRPFGLEVDTSGNVYVADRDYNRVRKLGTDGYITSFAGNGSEGFSGDGGLATDAKLNRPVGVAADVNGNVYIADTFNHRVRKVDPNGIMTTIAGTGTRGSAGDGGPAIDAQFQYTFDVEVDSDGNLYIADHLNCRIRKIDISGIITTVAGNGTCGISGDGGSALDAQLNYPENIKVDAQGNLFIAGNSNRVRKVDTSGIIVTVAGNGMGGYSGDGGPATEAELSAHDVAIAANGDLFIADWSHDAVRKVSTASASIAGVTTADETAFTDDSGIGYIMSAEGRHQRTIELDTGLILNEFGYDEDNNLLFVIDQFGNQITIEWQNGVPTAVISPDGITTELTVDPFTHHLTHITYPDGSFYEFEYTPDGLLELKTQPKGNQFGHAFDSNGRITDFTDDEGGHWQFFRTTQPNGDVLHETLTGEQDLTTYLESSFSTGAHRSMTTYPWGSETVFDVFERSEDGLRENLSLSCGMELEYTYDVDTEYTYKYVTEMIERTPIMGLERITQMSKNYADEDEDGIPDLITELTGVNGKMAGLLHDIPNSQMTLTSPEGRTRTIFYDPYTLLPTRQQVPEFHDAVFEYDIRGRIKTITAGVRQTVFDYVDDDRGLQIIVTDPEGLQSVYEFDTLDRLGLIQRPDGGSLGFYYDKNGNMELLVNPSGIEHDFEYTEVNLKALYVTPLSGEYSYVYDKDRRLKEVHFPSGMLIKNVYENGRLELIDLPEPETDVDLSYYPCGNNLESISQGIESISFGYDGSLLTSQDSFGTLGQSLAYTYNNDFRMETFEYAGQKESYAYDNDGLLTAAGRFAIGRNFGNGLPETVTGADFSLVRDFNGFGELDSEIVTVKGQPVASWSVTARYGDGRIHTKTETVAGETSTYVYTYDKAGRIQTVTKDGTLVEEYQYDPDGTGTRVSEMNTQREFVNRSLTYSDEDQLLTAGDTDYKYDPDGFLTTKTRYEEIPELGDIIAMTDYQYSSRGELISVNMQPEGEVAKIVEYIHDPYGRRIAKIVDRSIKEKYLWQGMTRLLAVYDGNDNLLMRFEYTDGRMPYAVVKGGEPYYLAYDQVGSLRIVVDAAGQVKKRIDYDSFGNVILDTAPTFTVPFGFGGGLKDQDTGLVRFGFRDYDPDVGRWTAKDPILFAGGDTDLYGYVLNDPINLIDPLGLEFSDILPGIKKAIVEGTKGGTYAVGEAAKATVDIAMHGHPLAQTALGVAFVSEAAPAAIAGGIYASSSTIFLYSAPTIYNFLMGPIKGNPPITVTGREAWRMIEMTEEYYNGEDKPNNCP